MFSKPNYHQAINSPLHAFLDWKEDRL